MRDKYNLNTMPASANDTEEILTAESNIIPMIPGMAPEDRVDIPNIPVHIPGGIPVGIPGIPEQTDLSRVPPPPHVTQRGNQRNQEQEILDSNKKKMPFSKPIPKSFQNSWNDVNSGPMPPPPHPQPQPQGSQQEFGIPPGCLSLQVRRVSCT